MKREYEIVLSDLSEDTRWSYVIGKLTDAHRVHLAKWYLEQQPWVREKIRSYCPGYYKIIETGQICELSRYEEGMDDTCSKCTVRVNHKGLPPMELTLSFDEIEWIGWDIPDGIEFLDVDSEVAQKFWLYVEALELKGYDRHSAVFYAAVEYGYDIGYSERDMECLMHFLKLQKEGHTLH